MCRVQIPGPVPGMGAAGPVPGMAAAGPVPGMGAAGPVPGMAAAGPVPGWRLLLLMLCQRWHLLLVLGNAAPYVPLLSRPICCLDLTVA